MSGRRIPKAKKATISKKEVKKPIFHYTPSAISFSFETMERTEYFNLDGTCINWSSELFDMLKEISKLKKSELLSGDYARSTYRVHSHENANPPSELPSGVELKDCYQIRISKSKGGIHGVFFDDVFYVIWLDPLHNMYPDDRYGGLRKIQPPKSCCKDREEIIEKLQNENKKLKEENESLVNLFDELSVDISSN